MEHDRWRFFRRRLHRTSSVRLNGAGRHSQIVGICPVSAVRSAMEVRFQMLNLVNVRSRCRREHIVVTDVPGVHVPLAKARLSVFISRMIIDDTPR